MVMVGTLIPTANQSAAIQDSTTHPKGILRGRRVELSRLDKAFVSAYAIQPHSTDQTNSPSTLASCATPRIWTYLIGIREADLTRGGGRRRPQPGSPVAAPLAVGRNHVNSFNASSYRVLRGKFTSSRNECTRLNKHTRSGPPVSARRVLV